MNYIKFEFKARFGAIGLLLDQADEMWRKRKYLTSILLILWTVVCTVIGMLLLPITLIIGAIKWHSDLDEFEEAIEEVLGNHNNSEN